MSFSARRICCVWPQWVQVADFFVDTRATPQKQQSKWYSTATGDGPRLRTRRTWMDLPQVLQVTFLSVEARVAPQEHCRWKTRSTSRSATISAVMGRLDPADTISPSRMFCRAASVSTWGVYCFRIQVAILSSATGEMVSSIWAYSVGEPVLAVWNK